jgi:hypothetical protein
MLPNESGLVTCDDKITDERDIKRVFSDRIFCKLNDFWVNSTHSYGVAIEGH